MDTAGLAGSAISTLGAHLARWLAGQAGDVADEATRAMLDLISERLGASQLGHRILQRFTAAPTDPAAQQDMAAAVGDEMTRDPAFGTALAEALTRLQAVEGSISGTVAGTGNVVVGGQLHNPGVIATGGSSVDRSRRTRIGTGGIILAVVVVFALALAAVALLTVTRGGEFDDIAGSWVPEETPADAEQVVTLRIDEDGVWEIARVGPSGEQVPCSGTTRRGRQADSYVLVTTRGDCFDLATSLTGGGNVLVTTTSEGSGRWQRRVG